MEAAALEYSESTTVTLDWALSGLKNLFDSSKGDAKSKVTKSARFGVDGRWQILFYANSGSSNGAENSGHISLYLSCEPTPEEKEAGANGKWVREGLFSFMFQLRPPGKTFIFNQKEAHNRTFSSKSPNLGWGQFAHRDVVYYHAPTVRNADSFVITCTITSNGAPPTPPPAVLKQTVPRDLMSSISSLLDDPLYSDVEFVFPRLGEGAHAMKRIYAISKLLKRCEYFDSMFNSGFMEGSQGDISMPFSSHDMTLASDVGDSDVEDDEEIVDGDYEDHSEDVHVEGVPARAEPSHPLSEDASEEPDPDTEGPPRHRPRLSLSSGSSPAAKRGLSLGQVIAVPPLTTGPLKMKVVVRDSSYWTYRAMLNYMYTDSIMFAPLSSSFIQPVKQEVAPIESTSILSLSSQTPAVEERPAFIVATKSMQSAEPSPALRPKTRKEWIDEWETANPGRIRPCSAKAIYRLADRLDLDDLKSRAFQHIVKSLTTTNIAYEVFSTFSATYEEVRKPMIAFFLDNWSDVRGSEAMRHVWQQIRLGGHPGFEEVWPLIALNLEFKTRSMEEPSVEASLST